MLLRDDSYGSLLKFRSGSLGIVNRIVKTDAFAPVPGKLDYNIPDGNDVSQLTYFF